MRILNSLSFRYGRDSKTAQTVPRNILYVISYFDLTSVNDRSKHPMSFVVFAVAVRFSSSEANKSDTQW